MLWLLRKKLVNIVKSNFMEQQKQYSAEHHAESKRIVSKSDAAKLKLIKYFTGVPCKRGHISDRLVSTGGCTTCNKLRKRGLIENIKKPKGFWLIKDNVLNEAKKYKSRKEMKLNNHPAYTGLCRLDLCLHAFPDDCKPNGYWTIERCFEAAKLYDDISKFSTGQHKAAYNKLCRKRLIMEASAHMHRERVSNNYWNKYTCKAEAIKYKTRNEFRQLSPGAYNKAITEDWMDDICIHMESGYKTSDTVYVWKVAGFDDLYKIGLSNKSVCNNRINIVASSHGYEVEKLWIFTVGVELAYLTERECLKFGNKADVSKNDGYTEFRHLTAVQLDELINKLDKLKVVNL